MPTVSGRQRKPLRFTCAYAKDQLGVLPDFVLSMVDVERASTHLAEEYIVITDDELSAVEADRQAPITAPARLEEHHRAALGNQISYGGQGDRSSGNPGSQS
jgi:hypothetical protein